MGILPDYKTALQLAVRARFVTIGIWLLIILAVIVLFSAQFSGRHPATVALDMGLSTIRLALPFLIVMLVQELITREFDRRYILTSLTYPRPRHYLFLGRLLAVITLVLLLLCLMGALLGGLVSYVATGYEQATPVNLGTPYLITLLFIAVDLITVATLGALIGLLATTPSFILISVIGFTVAARSYANMVALLEQQYDLVYQQEIYREYLSRMSYIMPDLGALDVRMISLYDSMQFLPANWPLLLGNVAAYVVLFIALSLWIFQRKRFS